MDTDKKPDKIRIEFYGIPRERAGVDSIDVEAATLAEAIHSIAAQLPTLAGTCIKDGKLAAGYLANINGKMFTTDPTTSLASSDTVLILSADVGG